MIEHVISGSNNTDVAKGCNVLVLNCGSSSIRFAIYQLRPRVLVLLSGKIDGVGSDTCELTATLPLDSTSVALDGNGSIPAQLLDWLERQPMFSSVNAVGHRIVHGMEQSEAQLITPALRKNLQRHAKVAPLHLPLALTCIESIALRHTALAQIACFDTAFHHNMPHVARQLALPRDYETAGLRRYGFHGLSCEYLMQALQQLADPAAISGRVILAHLGSGVSLTAVKNGQSIDSSMGFTPAGGVMMATRSGDLDPGVLSFLLRTQQLDAEQFDALLNQRSGLLGVSQTSADIRVLLDLEAQDARAAEAIELFCYQITKAIGAYSAALGGLDTLVFAGGIGEHVASIRARICSRLAFLGIEIAPLANDQHASIISVVDGPVTVRVIPTNEELIIAANVAQHLGFPIDMEQSDDQQSARAL